MPRKSLEIIHSWQLESQEIHYQAAFAFIKHFKKFCEEHNSTSLRLSQKILYKDFEYPKKLISHWNWLGKNAKESVSEPHECAVELGLMDINTTTKPHTYTLKETDKILLRPYQLAITKQVKESTSSVLIEAPTGSGKSVIACEIAKNEIQKGGIILIVAPKIILLEQLQETFTDLEPQIIHGPYDYDRKHSVFISTLQTAHKRELGFEPTMIIIDEVHFGFSGKMIETLLEDFNGRLIGLSATPYDQNSQPIKGFDKHISTYDLNYMFEYNYLVQPICYAPVKVDLSHIAVQAGDYSQLELDKSFNNFENIKQIVVNSKDLITQQKAALIFCINISHAKAVAEAFNNAGIPTKAIHSKLSKIEQNVIIDEYKQGKIKMLANPMMLTTGFDDPATDCIILARATKSQNLYRQMIGRGLRLFEGKTYAKIIDCAGVIDNLGLPTEPQKPNAMPLSKKISCCPHCQGTRLYRTTNNWNNEVYRKCADCGHSEEIIQQGCVCEICGAIHGSNADYVMKDSDLYLNCSICSHQTLISSKSSAQELREIFNEQQIKDIQTEFTFAYIEYLYTQAPVDLPFREDVARHIIALQNYIASNLPDFMATNFKKIKDEYQPFRESKYNDPKEYQSDFLASWEWKREGRLFGLELEAELLGTNIDILKKQLKNAQDPFEALELVHKLLKSKGEGILEATEKEIFFQQLKETIIDNIEIMCVKRLQDIYTNNESIAELLKFIPMMESVLNNSKQ